MSQPIWIAGPRLQLLTLTIWSGLGFVHPVVLAENAEGFYEQLQALSSGNTELSSDATQEFESTAYEPSEGLAGVTLGMSMEDVIGVWGLPKRICMQNRATVLSIAKGSQFSFVENKLVTVRVHSADLPEMKLSNGVDFSFSPSQLADAYEIENPAGRNYVTDLTEDIELQFYYTNIGNQGLRMATMAIVRKP